jgi:hypothetical protein
LTPALNTLSSTRLVLTEVPPVSVVSKPLERDVPVLELDAEIGREQAMPAPKNQPPRVPDVLPEPIRPTMFEVASKPTLAMAPPPVA